jgi:type I restriction enzyme, S subunit
MSFPRYNKTKPSGVEWLGDVPEHWEVKRLSYFCDFQSGKAHEPFVDDDGEFICVNSRFVSTEGRSRKYCTKNLSPAQRNDILMVISDLPNGKALAKAYFVEDESSLAVNQRVCILTPRHGLPRFLFYFLNRSQGFLQHDDGISQTHLSNDLFTKFQTLMPPLSEQIQIAAFLDRETAKIDALVAEQRRLMELLKEKRQAVISHAVTHGLNPKAPMKPSGIEWLGDVPEHWEVKKIKHLSNSIEQGWSPQCEGFPAEAENEWGVLKVGCVNGGVFNSTENKLLPPELEPIPCLALSRGDLLISRANTRELVGSAAVVEQDYPTLMLCDKLYRVRFHPDLCCPWFISRYLGSTAVRGQIELRATGASASMVNIPQSAILDLVIAAPPIEEQRNIIASLDLKLAKLDTLTAEAQRAIDLLQERRTALISAAVTGQIDVRS